MKRRDFLKQTLFLSLAAGLIPSLWKGINSKAFAGELPSLPESLLAVAKGTDYQALVHAVLQPLGGMKAFVKAGNKVVVKPNIGWDRSPEQAANTNPLVVKGLVQAVLEAGAAQVLVFDRTCNNSKMCYKNSGIQAVVESLKDPRAQCVFMDDRKYINTAIPDGQGIKEWGFYRDALEADCYINVPIAKNHGITKLTLGLKNIMGVIDGKRGLLHQNIAEKLADLNSVLRPKLTVIDATRILLRNGPQGGNLEDVEVMNTLIASTDPVAADAYATTLFGMKPSDLETTVAAYKKGLGEMDLEKVKIITV